MERHHLIRIILAGLAMLGTTGCFPVPTARGYGTPVDLGGRSIIAGAGGFINEREPFERDGERFDEHTFGLPTITMQGVAGYDNWLFATYGMTNLVPEVTAAVQLVGHDHKDPFKLSVEVGAQTSFIGPPGFANAHMGLATSLRHERLGTFYLACRRHAGRYTYLDYDGWESEHYNRTALFLGHMMADLNRPTLELGFTVSDGDDRIKSYALSLNLIWYRQ